MLVGMTVLAVWLGTWLDRGRREEAAVAALERKEYAGIHYDHELGGDGNWYKVGVDRKGVKTAGPRGPQWARDWIGEHCFTRVVRLSTFSSVLDDDALAQVAQFRQLRMLRNNVMMVSVVEATAPWPTPENCVFDGGITDTGLAHLRRLTCLETLVLVGTNVTDDGLQHLTRLQRLKHLKISSSNITDEGISHVLKLRNLEDLCVSGTSISEAGVAELRRALPKCRVIGAADVPDREEEETRLGI